MTLYRETYKIYKPLPDFSQINFILKEHTGLDSEVEKLTESSAVFSNKVLKTDIEVNISSDENLELYFLPKKTKNYYEYSFLYILEKYLSPSEINVPDYVKKKWRDLTFIEKHIKR